MDRKTPVRKPAVSTTVTRRRKRAAPAKKVVRRRRVSSGMSAANFKSSVSSATSGAIGGAVAQLGSQYITGPLGDVLGGSLRPYAKSISMFGVAVVVDMFKVGGAKSKLLAAGAAGAAGAELASATIGTALMDNGGGGPGYAAPMPLSEYSPSSGFMSDGLEDYGNNYGY